MDKDFFEKEIETHSGTLYRVAYTILWSDNASKDALQDAELKVYRE